MGSCENANVSNFHSDTGAGVTNLEAQVERVRAGSSDPENHDMKYSAFSDISPCARPERNFLLAQLSAAGKARLFPQLELVQLKPGTVIYEADEIVTHAYFPVDCLLSTLYEMKDGNTAGVALTGSDGFAGVSMLLSDGTSQTRTVVQSAGQVYRLKVQTLKSEFDNNQDLRDLLLRYVQMLLAECAQLAACNRHHWVEQRLCRLLLSSSDRLDSDTVGMTQQLIADMLGARREGVTIAAGKLQELGLISCHRGSITIVDRIGVEQRACECYEVIARESDRLLHQRPSVLKAV